MPMTMHIYLQSCKYPHSTAISRINIMYPIKRFPSTFRYQSLHTTEYAREYKRLWERKNTSFSSTFLSPFSISLRQKNAWEQCILDVSSYGRSLFLLKLQEYSRRKQKWRPILFLGQGQNGYLSKSLFLGIGH